MNEVQRGGGRTLLLIHGLGGSWQSWSTIMGALSAERTVIAIDLPGHGATPSNPDSGTFDGLVGSVERYIGDEGRDGVDIVGSSMGARIVLELARRGRVGNVVALDPGGMLLGTFRAARWGDFAVTDPALMRFLARAPRSMHAILTNF